MARAPRVVVLALVVFAIIGLACAAEAPSSRPSEDDYEEDDSEFLIGIRSGDAPSPNGVVAGPIGGPVPPGAFDQATTPPSAAASSLRHFSAGAAATAAALAGFFYF